MALRDTFNGHGGGRLTLGLEFFWNLYDSEIPQLPKGLAVSVASLPCDRHTEVIASYCLNRQHKNASSKCIICFSHLPVFLQTALVCDPPSPWRDHSVNSAVLQTSG